jgi:hypothetical protein
MLLLRSSELHEGDAWLCELKLDAFRSIAFTYVKRQVGLNPSPVGKFLTAGAADLISNELDYSVVKHVAVEVPVVHHIRENYLSDRSQGERR